MAVIRVNKTKDFTVMSNAHFKERGMSLKAKGLLSLMLSLPDEWDYSVRGLATLSKDGKASVMKALSELESFGYLKTVRARDENGRFSGYDYDVYEDPQTEKPYTENRDTDKRDAEKPYTENRTQLNTNTLTTNQLKTNGLSTDVVKGAADYSDPQKILLPYKGLMLTDEQLDDLVDKMGTDAFDDYVERLVDFIVDTGAKVKNHYATILKWYNEDRGVI